MKTWAAIFLLAVLFYGLLRLNQRGGIGKRGVLGRLNFYVNLLFWLLILLYGITLIRWGWRQFFP